MKRVALPLLLACAFAGVAKAQFCLKQHPPQPAVNTPVWGACCDVDGDGGADLVMADTSGGTSSVSIFPGNGDGTFGAPTNIPVGTDVVSVECCDVDLDGDVDLVAADLAGDVWKLTNDGTGSFSVAVIPLLAQSCFDLVCCDVDLDGDPDLAVAAPTAAADVVQILVNDGTGTFTPGSIGSVSGDPVAIVCCDLEGDGDPDLATANVGLSGGVTVLLNDGAGNLTPTDYPVGSLAPQHLACCELNGDGLPDLAVATAVPDGLSVLLNLGAGAFGAPTSYAAGADPRYVTCADFDCDGDNDLVAANHVPAAGGLSGFENDGTGNLTPRLGFVGGLGDPVFVEACELNGDGQVDLVVAEQTAAPGRVSGFCNYTCVPFPEAIAFYGCGVNPAGSFTLVAGTPRIGTTLVLGVDNPLGTQAPGSTPFVQLAVLPDPAFRCGTPIPGLGMAGGGAPGELLLNLATLIPPPIGGAPWAGPGNPAPVFLPIPYDCNLLGAVVYAQGSMVDPTSATLPIALADAAQLTIGGN